MTARRTLRNNDRDPAAHPGVRGPEPLEPDYRQQQEDA
jgi:hypothetical protein